MKKQTLIAVFGTAIGLWSCSSDKEAETSVPPETPEVVEFAEGDTWNAASELPSPRAEYAEIALSDADKEIIKAQNDFALDLFRQMSEKDRENSLLSPVSLSLNLGMLINGAAGDTYDDLCKMTGIGDAADLAHLNALNKKLIDGLMSADKSSRMSLANSIWIESGYNVTSGFVSRNCDNYYAEIYRRDLSERSTMEEINAWAEDKTQGIIKNLLEEPFSDDIRLTLVNALYFYGTWVNPFFRDFTYKCKFTCLDGEETKVDMMHHPENNIMAENGFVRVAYMPFGNGAYQMAFILPNEGVTFESAKASLTTETLARLEAEAKKTGIDALNVPRFEIGSEKRFKDVLGAMGYARLFTPDADFSEINPLERLYISDIVQKNNLKIDEEGAEGAAVTYEPICGSNGKERPMVLDRPFIFMVTEKSSGCILFIGDVKKL